MRLGAHDGDGGPGLAGAGPVARGPHGGQRLVVRLRAGLGHDEPFEDMVHPVDDGLDGAEVGAQVHRVVAADEAPRFEEDGDVGATEPVDRLLRVADDEQAARDGVQRAPVGTLVGGWCGDPHRQLDLDGVGVLELVEQDAPVAVVQHGADGGAVRAAQQVARQHEEIVELEPAVAAPFLGGRQCEATDLGAEAAQAVIGHAGA